MIQPIQILINEHGRIREMLSHFEKQIDRLQRVETPDYEILEGAIAYCQEYLDHWHHPREDTLVDLLQRRAPMETKASAELGNQHGHLARATSDLVVIFDSVHHDMVYKRANLVEMGRALVRDYRHHLDWEEANLFPAISDNLLAEDWQELAPLFADANDPLAKNPVDQRFRALFNAIEQAETRSTSE